MTTTRTKRATSPARTELDLDTRLTLRGAAMNVALDQAAVGFEVNTSHIAAEPAVAPSWLPTAAPLHTPYRTPIAACLQKAQRLMETAGWCADRARDARGAVCPVQAIRSEARNRREADKACVLLLDVIRREFDPNAETIPSWNSRQHGPRIPIRVIGRAADHADSRGI